VGEEGGKHVREELCSSSLYFPMLNSYWSNNNG
jgi:hypothetical protein